MMQKHLLYIRQLIFVILLTSCAPLESTSDALEQIDPSPTSHDPVSYIANYLDELNAEEKYSGVVLLAKDGEPVLERAFGYANLNYDVPNQMDTKFNLGSMNKMFTAIAIMQLAEQGKLTVDDKLITHLPDFPNQEVAEQVTIHQILTHTSGIGDFFHQEFRDSSNDLYKTHADYLPLFVDRPLLFTPGTRGSYSNAGYLVLGLAIEEITGTSYFDYVRENIYLPCGMIDTDAYEIDRVVPNIAVGYAGNIRNYGVPASNIFWLPYKGSSAGGGYSTAGDLLRFSNCLLGHQLLSPEWTDILLEGKVDNPIPGMGGKYAYGFIDSTINDHRIVGHGGALHGVCTNLAIFPDLGYTAVILSNTTYDCIRVISTVHDTLLE